VEVVARGSDIDWSWDEEKDVMSAEAFGAGDHAEIRDPMAARLASWCTPLWGEWSAASGRQPVEKEKIGDIQTEMCGKGGLMPQVSGRFVAGLKISIGENCRPARWQSNPRGLGKEQGEGIQFDGLDLVMIESGRLGAVVILFQAVAGSGDD